MSRETDLAWLAGMIDGEGHIGIGFQKPGRYRGGFRVNLDVTNTSPAAISKCLEIMGIGKIYTSRKYSKAHKRKRPVFVWGVRGPNVTATLNSVLQYLVIKADQAKLAMRAQELAGTHGKFNPNHAELHWLRDQIHALHMGLGETAPVYIDESGQGRLELE